MKFVQNKKKCNNVIHLNKKKKQFITLPLIFILVLLTSENADFIIITAQIITIYYDVIFVP